MILNILGLSYGCGILTTISLCKFKYLFTVICLLYHCVTAVPIWRKKFSQDTPEGLYSGTTLLVAYNAVSIPFSAVSAVLASCVIYPYVILYTLFIYLHLQHIDVFNFQSLIGQQVQ